MAQPTPHGPFQNLGHVTGQITIPAPLDYTGTFAATFGGANDTLVLGTGTKFYEEISIGDYLYSVSLHSARRVTGILTQDKLRIDSPFPAAVGADLVKILTASEFEQVSILNIGAANILVNDAPVAANTGHNITSSSPVWIDATGSTAQIGKTQNR